MESWLIKDLGNKSQISVGSKEDWANLNPYTAYPMKCPLKMIVFFRKIKVKGQVSDFLIKDIDIIMKLHIFPRYGNTFFHMK